MWVSNYVQGLRVVFACVPHALINQRFADASSPKFRIDK
jgi:hypothetical protein